MDPVKLIRTYLHIALPASIILNLFKVFGSKKGTVTDPSPVHPDPSLAKNLDSEIVFSLKIQLCERNPLPN